MKANDIIKTLLVAGVALVGLSSCQERLIRFTKGEAVKFTAGSAGSSTKAVYGDVIKDEKTQEPIKVAINWEEGDLVRIFCEECGSPEIGDPDSRYADYVVTGFGETMSQAHLAQQTETILRWGGEKVHNFYAVYPTPEVSEGGISYFPKNTTDEAKLTASVPKTIAAAQAVDGVIKPDFKYQYMVAKTSADGWSDDNIGVFLTFQPLVTAIQFTIKNGTGKNLDIDAVELISEKHNLSGTFTATLAKESWTSTYPSVWAYSGSLTNNVLMDFTGADHKGFASIENSEDASLTFTMFLMPCYEGGESVDINDITFKLYKHDDDDPENRSWVSTKLAYNDAKKTGVPFPNHKMTYVTGLIVPDGAQWTVKYSADVDAWGNGGSQPTNPMPELKPEPFVTAWTDGGTAYPYMQKYDYRISLTNITDPSHPAVIDDGIEFSHSGTSSYKMKVNSVRQYEHRGPEFPVLWYMEYFNGTEWVQAKAGEQINGFLTLNPTSGTGDEEIGGKDAVEINLVVSAAADPQAPLSHSERLQSTPRKGDGEDGPYDLSMYDIYGNRRPDDKLVTANSYIVNGPGKYVFPAVYGNAVDFISAPAGGDNALAYDPGTEMPSTVEYLSRFINAYGNGIKYPFIDADLSEQTGDWQVTVLWQDNANVSVTPSYISKGAADMDIACGYVQFDLASTGLAQSNFVLALKKGGKIVWSWHIWVTDNDLSCKNIPNTTVSMLPFNLGWIDSDDEGYSYWSGASARLRIVQSGSGVVKEFTVTRKAENDAPHEEGIAPFWQWGRKDPFLPGCYSVNTYSKSSTHDIAFSIKNPNIFLKLPDNNPPHQWYYQKFQTESGAKEATFLNLWSATNNRVGTGAEGYDTKPVKTVYDPCPPGFQVPRVNAFDNLTESLPRKGYLRFSTGELTYPENGYYWLAAPYQTDLGYYFLVDESHVNGILQGDGFRASAMSIRPIQQ